MLSAIADRIVCLLLDKRDFNRELISVDLGRYFSGEIQYFRVGEGKIFPKETYGHINVEPPKRSGYRAWKDRPNSYNAFLSFREIIKQAVIDNVTSLLILEDDAVSVDALPLHLPSALTELPVIDPEWELLYLGANHTFSRTVPVSDTLLRLNGSGCWHAVLLHARSFPLILDLSLLGPIDGEVAKKVHPRGHSYAVWPNLVWTRPGYSHCEGFEVDYSHYFLNRGC